MNTRSNLSIFKNQGTPVEVTVIQQFNKDTRKKCADIDEGDSRRPVKKQICTEQFISSSIFGAFLSGKKYIRNKLILFKENIHNNNCSNHANKISSKTSTY